jgi:transcription elongation factor Elf1
MERMRECPLCADGKLDVIVVQDAPRRYVVRCQECGAQGPGGNGKPEHAVDAWNLRYGRLVLVKQRRSSLI